jgi:pilus assembly protein Flp/PilA
VRPLVVLCGATRGFFIEFAAGIHRHVERNDGNDHKDGGHFVALNDYSLTRFNPDLRFGTNPPHPFGNRTMKSIFVACRRFVREEEGPTAVEYAVMLALIIVACITTVRTLGTNANASFQKVTTTLQTANS